MRVEHLFDIYAKPYMPTHHFEIYASFFFYALVTCSVLWRVMYVIFSCGKHIHKHPCLSISLSVRPSVPAFASTFHHRLPQNEKQTYRLMSRHQMWPSSLTLAMTLTLNFPGQLWNLLYLSQKMVRLPRNEKQAYRLKPGTQMWPSDLTLAITLTLSFQSQIWNLQYLNEKWSDCYETKNKISIELQASNVTNGFDLDNDLDIWIFKVKCDLDHLVTKVRRKDLPDRDRGDFRCRRAVDSSS